VIMNAQGQRKLFVIVDGDGTRENGNFSQRLRDTFMKHAFQLDNTGEPTEEPDDGEFSDTGDSIRYLFQNVASTKGKGPMVAGGQSGGTKPEAPQTVMQTLRDVRNYQNPAENMVNKQTGAIYETVQPDKPQPSKGGKKGFKWTL